MSEEDLRECPFCGENMPKRDNNDYNEYIVWCENCGAIGPNNLSIDETDEMWNLRRPYDAIRAENAKLRAALESLRRGDKEHDSYCACAYGDQDGLNFCTCSSRNTNAIIDAALKGDG